MNRPVVKLIFALVSLVAFAMLVRLAPVLGAHESVRKDLFGISFEPPGQALLRTGASLGLLLIGGWLAGRIVASFGIAKVTGYLVFGALVGPYVLGAIGHDEVEYLTLINDLAIALIALTAGSEIRVQFLKESWLKVLLLTISQLVCVIVLIFFLMLLVLPIIGIATNDHFPMLAAIALIVATVAALNSPVVVIAVIAELRAHGPMCKLALAVTVCKDMPLVILFAIVLAMGSLVIGQADSSSANQSSFMATLESDGAPPITSPSSAADPDQALDQPESQDVLSMAAPVVQHLIGSLVIGAIVGIFMAAYMHWIGAHVPIFIVFSCFGIALMSEAMHLEALLVAVTAGMLMQNVWPESSEAMFESVEELSLPVYCVFFAVAGLRVDLGVVATMWHWAMLAVLARAAAVWLGIHLGCRVSGVEKGVVRTWLWTAFIPQAGVSIAFATIARDTFQDHAFSVIMFNLLMTMIAIHELIGPIFLKIGLTKAGETDSTR